MKTLLNGFNLEIFWVDYIMLRKLIQLNELFQKFIPFFLINDLRRCKKKK